MIDYGKLVRMTDQFWNENNAVNGPSGASRMNYFLSNLVVAINDELSSMREGFLRDLVQGVRDLPDDQVEAAGAALLAEYERRRRGDPYVPPEPEPLAGGHEAANARLQGQVHREWCRANCPTERTHLASCPVVQRTPPEPTFAPCRDWARLRAAGRGEDAMLCHLRDGHSGPCSGILPGTPDAIVETCRRLVGTWRGRAEYCDLLAGHVGQCVSVPPGYTPSRGVAR